MVFLIQEYRQGGILFDKDTNPTGKWQAILEETPPSDTDLQPLTPVITQQTDKTTADPDGENTVDAPEMLYKKAQAYLQHPAKDTILHKRAIDYLTRAAYAGHSAAAVQLAKLANEDTSATYAEQISSTMVYNGCCRC